MRIRVNNKTMKHRKRNNECNAADQTRSTCCSRMVSQTASKRRRCCVKSREQRHHHRRRRRRCGQAVERWRHRTVRDVWLLLDRRAWDVDWRWCPPTIRRCDDEERRRQAVPDRRHARRSDSRRCSGLEIGSPGRQQYYHSTQFGRPSASGRAACHAPHRRGCWRIAAAAGRRRKVRTVHSDDVDGRDNVRRDWRREISAELCNDTHRLQQCKHANS